MLDNSILLDGQQAKTVRENLKKVVELNQQAKDIKQSIEKALGNIVDAIGEDALNQTETLKYELACGGVFAITKATTKKQVDGTRLKKEKPEIFEEYSKEIFTQGYIDKKSIVL